ncbi:MAG: hypothetical protein V1800_06060 [Candidatus Latescibacterota bacterium]
MESSSEGWVKEKKLTNTSLTYCPFNTKSTKIFQGVVYIRDHSEAEFTHGICPECMQKLYPEYVKKVEQGSSANSYDSSD